MQARPCRQVGPKLPNRGVETNCCHEGCPILGADTKNTLVPEHQIQEATVRYFDRFRAPGRTRGVDQISQIAWFNGYGRGTCRASSENLRVTIEGYGHPRTVTETRLLARICHHE